MSEIVDLRSDTVTRPTPDMYDAMMRAPVGDDTYREDPTVNVLQERVAAMLGFEEAMFVPTGTQSNLCAILAHCGRGDEYIVGHNAHCYRWEGGGAAVFGGVQPQPIEHAPDGTLPLEKIAGEIKPANEHFATTRLLTLENTLGGRVMPRDYVNAAVSLAAAYGLATHLDGARLFNAAIAQTTATGVSPAIEAYRIAGRFDSVSVCFSKGLGAPAGSMLCGSAEFIGRARRIRKIAGGAMRQAGVLAAAALYALDHNIERLAEDHRRAKLLATGLSAVAEIQVDATETNVVFLELSEGARGRLDELVNYLRHRGILVASHYRLRLVTHMDVDDKGVWRAVAAIREFFER
ncbi:MULTISPECIES: low-specificity L-threonine aldolase [unclassified Burkholderia]|uniref:low-specificity L-threonine aldolase n=1 Tax=unclassified Burkholderia TaxID=2613784 RepID=UPI000F569DCE|nr:MULTISPECIES: low-specificity L-threonine aldolase [unclassified Burkholderia]RQR68761.1 low-specificity L-threonine aldolase [Burkholderia sp. Bp9012]RQR70269.1 low-specificity L-threonine aldolase [Burkholderia sp. Bp9011]RQR83015.1 low-specificity L-threonine aldolase [Burkholderia sp. Bp9010]RQZ39424.1 low-specificity L-threonine aldolase [Burkholderia sp. Bp9099]